MVNHRVAASSLTGGMHATYSVARRGLGLSGWRPPEYPLPARIASDPANSKVSPNPLLPTIFRRAFRLSRMIYHFTHTVWERPDTNKGRILTRRAAGQQRRRAAAAPSPGSRETSLPAEIAIRRCNGGHVRPATPVRRIRDLPLPPKETPLPFLAWLSEADLLSLFINKLSTVRCSMHITSITLGQASGSTIKREKRGKWSQNLYIPYSHRRSNVLI